MAQVKRSMDTSAGPDLVSRLFLRLTWASHVKRRNFLELWIANEQKICSEGEILLHLQVGNLCIHLLFGVVKILVLVSFLETSFIDKNIRENFPAERKLVPWPSQTG